MFETAASSAPQEPLALVLGSALAAQTYDAIGQFDRSLVGYRRALEAWTWEYWRDLTPTPLRVSRPSPPGGESPTLRPVTQQNLIDRVASLDRNLKAAVGPLLERASSQINMRRFTDARVTLASAANQARSDDDRTAVRLLDHRAQLEMAMDLLAVDPAQADVAGSLKALDAILTEAFDTNVGFARLAKAAVMFKNGAAEHAQVLMKATLDEWRDAQQKRRATKPASPLEADVADIRSLTFRSIGTVAVLAPNSMLAKAYPLPPGVAVVNPDVRVTTQDGKTIRITVYQDLPEERQAVFWTTDEIAFALRLVNTLAGPRRATGAGALNPTPPAAALAELRNFWNSFFATRDGNMGAWVVQTYPSVTSITFLDASRTKAAVGVRADAYSGATIIMEKKNGVWVALRIVNQWVS